MGICNSKSGVHKAQKPKEGKGLKIIKKIDLEELRHCRGALIKSVDMPISSNDVVSCSTGLPLDKYIVDSKIGEGTYGEVFKVKNKELGIFRAMKKIDVPDNNPEKVKEIKNEINLLKSMDHPNIVKILEFYYSNNSFFLIMEYCNGEELYDQIIKYKHFSEEKAAYIMYQVLSAVFYCHNMSIIHRDLKPENILIDSSGENFSVKIIDFGTSLTFEDNKKIAPKKVIGSIYYVAPEVLSGKYNEKCDIWSCGVILYILLSGKPPFGGEDTEIIEKIKIGKFNLKSDPWPKVSNEAKDLIKLMLDTNNLTRISAQDALSHLWFKKFRMKEKYNSFINLDKLLKSINNIKKYKSDSRLQQVILTFLVHNSMYFPEVKELINVFKQIDSNGDGKITKKEMIYILAKHYNLINAEDEVNKIFENVDIDHNGFIEYEEYIQASISKKDLLSQDQLIYAFKYFDKDNDGSITADEIAQILFQDQKSDAITKLTEDLIREVDIDLNKKINFEEFKTMMLKLISS